MKLPHLFRQIHGNAIFKAWMKYDQAPLIKLIPQEPLGRVSLYPPNRRMPDYFTVPLVTVRCWNDRGVMDYEAASPADLNVAQEWSERHRDTPPEEFTPHRPLD